MKQNILLSLLFLASISAAPLYAQDAEAETPQQEQAAAAISIPALLKEVKYVTKVQPKKKAALYLFLRSHSRCGFCRAITPQMNEAYKEMKGKGAELIMINCDPDSEKAAAWASQTGIEIPMITPESREPIASVVPGSGSGGTPNITVVTADGEKLEGDSGASRCKEIAANWKEMLKQAKKAEAKKKAEARKKTKKKKSKKKKSASSEL